jgi:hypothetical protein
LHYALGVTLLVELSVIAAYSRYKRIPTRKVLNLLALAAMINLLSLPVVWYVTLESYSEFGELSGFCSLLLAEVGATIFEGLAYAWIGGLGLRSGLGLSFLANTASLVMGLIL